MPFNNTKLIRSKLSIRYTDSNGWEVYTTVNGSSKDPDFKWIRITPERAEWYISTFPEMPVDNELAPKQTESTR